MPSDSPSVPGGPGRPGTPDRGLPWAPPAGVAGLLVLLLIGAACGSAARQFAAHARALGMPEDRVTGVGFDHVLFWHHRDRPGALHVYIDGDGRPWAGGAPSLEPTPRDRLILRLMSLDPGPSVYLGRPCYLGAGGTEPCTAAVWTNGRYSEAVVSSLAAALGRLVSRTGAERTVLIGYSGGGTLAVLLAPRSPSTVAVVTIAANLDVAGWARHHGYAPLTASLDPARQPPLPATLAQRHYVGGRDSVVPPAIVAGGPIAPGTLTVVADFDHTCCWPSMWPRIVEDLRRRRAAPGD